MSGDLSCEVVKQGRVGGVIDLGKEDQFPNNVVLWARFADTDLFAADDRPLSGAKVLSDQLGAVRLKLDGLKALHSKRLKSEGNLNLRLHQDFRDGDGLLLEEPQHLRCDRLGALWRDLGLEKSLAGIEDGYGISRDLPHCSLGCEVH